MNRRTFTPITLSLLTVFAFSDLAANTCSAITLGQVDTFAASAEGWGNVPGTAFQNAGLGTDGLAGHLEATSTGASGPGSRMVFWNDAQWTGDYIAAGVSEIQLFADNRSNNGQQIDLRLALNGNGSWFVTDIVLLADGSGWTPVTFGIEPGDLTFAAGTNDAAAALANITRLEILSDSGAPNNVGGGGVLIGDQIAANLRIDSITAIAAIPEPTTLALAALGLAGISFSRRRSR